MIQLERLLWLSGIASLCFCLFALAQMVFAQRAGARIVPISAMIVGVPIMGSQDGNAASPPERFASNRAGSNSPAVVGRIEIPAIGMVTPLLAGDDSMSLTEGAGHIPGTAFPGGLGTVGIAGHRDTHFRLLSRVAVGMDVRLIDRTGTYHYRVTSFEIVTPEQVSVLDIVSQPGLVLVTCYPFHYVGSAPKRFIVHAALLSVAPDESGLQPTN